jgi:hypothetical protein
MKKTWLAMLLVVVMLFSLVGCSNEQADQKSEPTAEPVAEVTEAPTEVPTEAPTEAPTPEPVQGVKKVTVLNTLVKDLTPAKGEETRFNAFWLPSYNIGEIAEKNFYFMPEATDVVAVVAYTDGYTDDGTDTYETLAAKGLSLKYTDAKGNEYDVFTGPTQKKDNMPQFMGYFTVGHVCALFMQPDGWNVKELFDEIAMAQADAYDFICADGYSETIQTADLEKVSIFDKDGSIDATSIAYPDYTLQNIRYIVPTGLTKESTPGEGIQQIVVMPNAEGILDTEAPYTLNFGGTVYEAYAVTDVMDKAGIASDTCKAISWKDGFEYEYDMEAFKASYICLNNKKGNDAFTCGQKQAYNALCKSAGYYVFDADALVYVPSVESLPDGYTVADLFKAIGMQEAASYNFICADGYKEEISADELANVKLFINAAGDGVDATSIAYPDQSLMNILTIEPAA